MKKIFSSLILSSTLAFASSNFGYMTTGGKTGNYIKIGNDLKDTFSKYNISLKIKESKGSKDNIELLLHNTKDIHWGIVQKDALNYYKYMKNVDLENKIKILFPLYNEEIHIFVKEGSNLKLNEKRNMKVAVSSPDSGSYITAKYIESSYDLKFDFMFVGFENAKALLKTDKIDMYIVVTAKGNENYQNLEDLDLLNMPSNLLIDSSYVKTSLSKKIYKWLKEDKIIYSVPSLIATNVLDKQNDKSIEAFIKIILSNYKNLQENGNDKWKYINFSSFNSLKDYHPQAIKTYKELKLYKDY